MLVTLQMIKDLFNFIIAFWLASVLMRNLNLKEGYGSDWAGSFWGVQEWNGWPY